MFYFHCCEMFTVVPLFLYLSFSPSDFIAAAVKVPSPPIREAKRRGILKFVNQYHYAIVLVV